MSDMYLEELSEKQLAILYGESNAKTPSTAIGYILFIFLGGLGVHRFYLGYPGTGWFILLSTIIGFLTVGLGLGIVLLFINGIILFIDMFTIPSLVRTKREDIKREIAKEMIARNRREAEYQARPKQITEQPPEPKVNEPGQQ